MSGMYEDMMEERDADVRESLEVYAEQGINAYYEYCEENDIEALSLDALEVLKF